jgi:histone H1/5
MIFVLSIKKQIKIQSKMASITQTKKDLTQRRNEVKKTVGKAHDTVLTTAEELVEGFVATGEKWQKLIAKTIKNSKPIVNKQLDIVFDGIETFQGQLKDGNKRFKKLTGVDPGKVAEQVMEETGKIVSLVQKTAQKAEERVTDLVDTVEDKAKDTLKIAEKKTKDAEAKVKKTVKKAEGKAKKTVRKTKSKAKTTAKKAKTTVKKARKAVRKAS